MEVNANPSLNVYSDRELPNGDIEQTLSEIDKYVKTNVVADTMAIVSSAPIFSNPKQMTQSATSKMYTSESPK